MEIRGRQGDLPGPTTRDQMENPDVLEISRGGGDTHLHRCRQGHTPPGPAAPWLCENSQYLAIIQGTGWGGWWKSWIDWKKKKIWMKRLWFDWVFPKMAGIELCYQTGLGLEIKIQFSYRTKFRTTESSVWAPRPPVLSRFVISHSQVIQLGISPPSLFSVTWKVVTNEHFAISTEVILSEKISLSLCLDNVVRPVHVSPPLHSALTSVYTDGWRCISPTFAAREVTPWPCPPQGFSSVSSGGLVRPGTLPQFGQTRALVPLVVSDSPGGPG